MPPAMSTPALALIGADGEIEHSTETFRLRYEDSAEFCRQSPQIERVLAGDADRAAVTLEGVSGEVEAVIERLEEYADAGGLIAYGPNFAEGWRRAATYVVKILKGAKPGELPVEQPTKFELVLNLKTSKALGLTMPPSLLRRADHVIQ